MALCACLAACGPEGPRDLKRAEAKADHDFYDMMFEDRVDTKYYDGPIFVEERDSGYVFRWVSNIPGARLSIWEGYVSRDPKHYTDFMNIQRGAISLSGTLDYPVGEAALVDLFRLPYNDNAETLRLRKVPLTLGQLEDVDKFAIIAGNISGFAYCYNCAYPDSLSWFKNVKERNYKIMCVINELDSVFTHDRYGHEYYYENFINYVVLGTPGANRMWDFEPAVLDSIYNDKLEHIYANGDDIIVKLIPESLGCD